MRCGRPVEDIRGHINEFGGECIDIRFGGVCRVCMLLTPFHFRWYPKQRRVLHLEGRKWVSYKITGGGWFDRALARLLAFGQGWSLS